MDRTNYIWIVATDYDGDKPYYSKKFFSYAMRLSGGSELKGQLDGVKHAHLCGTKKEAYRLANLWNKSYKANGTYMY